MSSHLHYKSTYCYSCGNLTTGKRCKVCGMAICEECNEMYDGKCDLCADNINRAESVLVGSMDNDYRTANSPNYY